LIRGPLEYDEEKAQRKQGQTVVNQEIWKNRKKNPPKRDKKREESPISLDSKKKSEGWENSKSCQ